MHGRRGAARKGKVTKGTGGRGHERTRRTGKEPRGKGNSVTRGDTKERMFPRRASPILPPPLHPPTHTHPPLISDKQPDQQAQASHEKPSVIYAARSAK